MNGTSAPHTPATPSPGSPLAGFFESVRRLGIWRSTDRWGGGVAAGIGHRYGIDPLVVRGLFVVVTMFGGVGLVLYGLAWALLPEASDGRIHLEQAVRGSFDIALAGAAAVVVVGISRPVFWWSSSWWTVPWLIALGALITYVLVGRDRRPGQPTFPTGAPPAPGHTAPWPDDGSPADGSDAPTSPPPPPRPAYDVPEDTMTRSSDAPAAPGTDLVPRPTAVGPAVDADATTRFATTDRPAGPTEPVAADPHEAGWSGAGGGWSGGGWGGANAGGPPPPPAPTPPPPVRGPGTRTTSLVLALSLLAAAGVALAHQQGALDANPWLVGGGAVMAILGAGVILSGLRGRAQGGIGALALFLALVMVPAAAAGAAVPGFSRIGTSATMWAGDPTWTPRTASEAEEGYTLVAGDLDVDLTDLDAEEDVTVPVSVTFGSLFLTVPDGANVTVNAGVGAGELVGALDDDWTGPGVPSGWLSDTQDSLTSGAGISATLHQEGTGPHIVIDAEVALGQIVIEETS